MHQRILDRGGCCMNAAWLMPGPDRPLPEHDRVERASDTGHKGLMTGVSAAAPSSLQMSGEMSGQRFSGV